MIYYHRPNDPCVTFSYDNLDRLTQAAYGAGGLGDNNEIFTMDDLGNHTNVTIRDGSNIAYAVDANTNRYNTVGGNNLTYDLAGNLTKDKDSYQYYYDYENRIVKITKNSSDIAEFSYDALGRRIRKRDFVGDANTIYYNNCNWQVLAEYDSSGSLQRKYVFGNFIDEVLLLLSGGPTKYYLHDHLYSPVALVGQAGSVIERYEYDAYGNPTIWNSTFTSTKSSSSYGNPYYFQGKHHDILDGGGLKVMYWPYRNYSTYLGRWYQQEKLGMLPNESPRANPFDPRKQYKEGGNLYQAFISNPLSNVDIEGLACWVKFKCSLNSQKKEGCDRHCFYQCVEIEREDRAGGDIMCSDVPKPMVKPDYQKHHSILCELTKGWCGKPKECEDSYPSKSIYYSSSSMPTRDCSKSDCMHNCDIAKEAALTACECLTPGKKAICKSLVYAAHSLCNHACDVWCQNP